MPSRPLRLAAIATAAGAFSGLFGVGGGTVIVPLLVLWAALDERRAAATSLAAIIPITIMAAGAHGLYGNVDLVKGLLLGVPGLAGWRWMHTPGHTPGHVSLFREADGVLLAGDAFATMNLDSWTAYLTRKRELSRPSPPFTFDWETTRRSVARLADLEPRVVAAGHGLPIAGDHVAAELRSFAGRLLPPRRGRYVTSPPRADERGVTELPPPVPDPFARRVAAGVTLTTTGLAALALRRGARSR